MTIFKNKNRFLHGIFQLENELGDKAQLQGTDGFYYDADHDGKDDATGVDLKKVADKSKIKPSTELDPEIEYKQDPQTKKYTVVLDANGDPKKKAGGFKASNPAAGGAGDGSKSLEELKVTKNNANTARDRARLDYDNIQKLSDYANSNADDKGNVDLSNAGSVVNDDGWWKRFQQTAFHGQEIKQIKIQLLQTKLNAANSTYQTASQSASEANANYINALKSLDPNSAEYKSALAQQKQAEAAEAEVQVGYDKNKKEFETKMAEVAASERSASKQLKGQVYQSEVAFSVAEQKAKIDSEYKVKDQIELDASDTKKDKFVPLLEKRMIDNLESSHLMPQIEIKFKDGAGVEQTNKVGAYSSIKVGSLGADRETPSAGKYSDFSYYYIPEHATNAGNQTHNGDLVNVDLKSPLVSKVSRVMNKETHEFDYIDNETHKAITGDEKKRIFASNSLTLDPKLQNGKNLTGYFIPAEEIDDLYENKSLGNGSQQAFSALGKTFGNTKYRREASEIIEGFLGGQMSLIQLAGKIFMLIKAGKDFHVGGKDGNPGSMELHDGKLGSNTPEDPLKVLAKLSDADKAKASEVLGISGSLKGLSDEQFTEKMTELKKDLKASNVPQKDIDAISSGAVVAYRKSVEENMLQYTKNEAAKEGFLTSLSGLVSNNDKELVAGKKGKKTVGDELTASEDIQMEKLLNSLKKDGITRIGGMDLENLDLSKIENIKAIKDNASGHYDIQFLDASKKKLGSMVLEK